MIRRRSFLIGGGGIVAAPVFARLTLGASAACDAPLPTTIADIACTPNVALRIDGWDGAVDSGNDVWVQINSSWRANWR